MTPVTVWRKWTKDKAGNEVLEFNHIEDGHALTDQPQPKDPSFVAQRQWASAKWTRSLGNLVGVVVEDLV